MTTWKTNPITIKKTNPITIKKTNPIKTKKSNPITNTVVVVSILAVIMTAGCIDFEPENSISFSVPDWIIGSWENSSSGTLYVFNENNFTVGETDFYEWAEDNNYDVWDEEFEENNGVQDIDIWSVYAASPGYDSSIPTYSFYHYETTPNSLTVLTGSGNTYELAKINGTGDGGNTNATQLCFYTTANDVGSISISVEGTYEGTLTQYFTSAPSFGATGTLTVTVDPGSVSFYAEAQTGVYWDYSVTVSEGQQRMVGLD